MTLARAIGLGALAALCAPLGCALVIGLDAGEPREGSAGGAGGAAVSPLCATKDDCPADTECASFTCADGQCVATPMPDGTPVLMGAAPGDCKKNVCEDGKPVAIPDVTDAPPDEGCAMTKCEADGSVSKENINEGQTCGAAANDCYEASVCESGTCASKPKPSGTSAGDDGTAGNCQGLVCDGTGQITTGADDTDMEADQDPTDCSRPACKNGSKASDNVVNGTACSAGGGVKCCNGVCCPTSHSCAETGECCPELQQCPNGTCCPTGMTCGLLNVCS